MITIPSKKIAEAEKIKQQTKEFLARGGKIKRLETTERSTKYNTFNRGEKL